MYYLHKNQWFLTQVETEGRSESKIGSSGLDRMTQADVLQLISSRFIHTILQCLKQNKEIRKSWLNHQKSIIEVSNSSRGYGQCITTFNMPCSLKLMQMIHAHFVYTVWWGIKHIQRLCCLWWTLSNCNETVMEARMSNPDVHYTLVSTLQSWHLCFTPSQPQQMLESSSRMLMNLP